MTPAHTPGSGHPCRAIGCEKTTARRLLFCRQHWRLVPWHIKQWVHESYRPGQELDGRPSTAYLGASEAAIAAVAAVEARAAEEPAQAAVSTPTGEEGGRP